MQLLGTRWVFFFFSSFLHGLFSFEPAKILSHPVSRMIAFTNTLTSLSFSFSLPYYLEAPLNAELVCCLSKTARGTLPPLTAAVGGLASQEALKAITGKFAPLQQWVGYNTLTVKKQISSLVAPSFLFLCNTGMETINGISFYSVLLCCV